MMSFDDFQYNNINPYIFDLNYHDKELKEMKKKEDAANLEALDEQQS